MLAVTLAVDSAFFGNSRYWHADVDPFLLIVLLLSAQYGGGFGVLAALASMAALLAGPLPSLTLTHDLYSYSVMIAQRPVTWIACALVLGGISRQHILRGRRLDRQLEEMDQQRDAVAAAYVESRQANEALILRLNCERMTLSSVSDAIHRLLKPSIDEIAAGVDELMAVTLGARKFSLYRMRDGVLEALRSQGWNGDDEYARTFSEHAPLFRAVVDNRRLLCVANPLDEVYLGRDGLLAGPICDPGTGDVLGMLKIEDLDFIRFGAEAIDNFRIAAEWLGFAFAGAAGPQTARIDLNRHKPVGRPDPLEGIRYGSTSAVDVDLAISVVSIRLRPIEGTVQDVAAVRESVRRAVYDTLQAERVIEAEGIGEFLLILPGASADVARHYVKTLEPALRRWLPSALQNVPIDIRNRALVLDGSFDHVAERAA